MVAIPAWLKFGPAYRDESFDRALAALVAEHEALLSMHGNS